MPGLTIITDNKGINKDSKQPELYIFLLKNNIINALNPRKSKILGFFDGWNSELDLSDIEFLRIIGGLQSNSVRYSFCAVLIASENKKAADFPLG